jgi:hypothetical protein
MNGRDARCRVDEVCAPPPSVRFEHRSHLGDRQPFGKRDGLQVHLAARELVNDLPRPKRLRESILPGLERSSVAAKAQRQVERHRIANHTSLDELAADGVDARPRGHLYEDLCAFVAPERSVHVQNRPHACHSQEDEEGQSPDHHASHEAWESR